MSEAEPIDHLRRLIEDVGELAGHQRGWKSRLSEAMGTHRSHISQVLSGKITSMSPRLLTSIAYRLGIRDSYFFKNPESRHFLEFKRTDDQVNWLAHLGAARTKAFEILGRSEQGAEVPPRLVEDLASEVFAALPTAGHIAVRVLLEKGKLEDKLVEHQAMPEPAYFARRTLALADREGANADDSDTALKARQSFSALIGDEDSIDR